MAQSQIQESVNIIGHEGDVEDRLVVGPPRITENLAPRENYDPVSPRALSSFGSSRIVPFGDIILARSGDKGANVNVGFTPRKIYDSAEVWEWLRGFLDERQAKRADGQRLAGLVPRRARGVSEDQSCALRRLWCPGKGVSSSVKLDSLGKGFAEWLRAVHVPVPIKFLEGGPRSKI